MSKEIETQSVKQDVNQENSTMKEFFSLMVYVAGVIILAIVLNKFIIQKVEVDGPSMNTTLKTGQQLLVEKVTYYFSDPKQGDIVVFDSPIEEDSLYIKRVIGVPGDKVQVKDGRIYLNGEEYEDPQWTEPILKAGVAEDEVTVGENEYFVVGDNRNDSSDSRDFGVISKDSIMGEAVLRIWPLNKFGVLH